MAEHVFLPVAVIWATLSVYSAASAAVSPVLPIWTEVSIQAPAPVTPIIVSFIVTLTCLVPRVHVTSHAAFPLQAMVMSTTAAGAVHTTAVLLVVVIIIVVITEYSVIR